MACFSSVKILKTVGVFICGLFLCSSISYGQVDWISDVTIDYRISIQDEFGVAEKYDAEFIVWDLDLKFTAERRVKRDQTKTVKFPEDFEIYSGSFDPEKPRMFYWSIVVKKQIVASGSFYYDSSPNATMQLHVYDFSKQKQLPFDGDFVDAYYWEDKSGLNVFMRSHLYHLNSKFLYAYHYRIDDDEHHLIRKFMDSEKGCKDTLTTEHIAPSLELTDLNKDSIGEILFAYRLACGESSKYDCKIMMTTNGEKYALRGGKSLMNSEIDNFPDTNLKRKLHYKDYVLEKWRREIVRDEYD